jgi:HAD superfamily hydrolase (TIGR01484 family)
VVALGRAAARSEPERVRLMAAGGLVTQDCDKTCGRIVLLSGDPGAGKTATCRRIAELARHKGLRVAGLLSESRALSSGRIVQTVVNLRTGERRRLAELVGEEAGDPFGRGLAGRFSWQFVADAMRWGRHELHRCASAGMDLFVIDQLGPLELVAGSGWANAVDALLEARYGLAVVAVNPLVGEELRRRLTARRPSEIELTGATREYLPEYLVAVCAAEGGLRNSLLQAPGPDWVVADLDGTLLDSGGELPAGLAAAVREVTRAGGAFALCTGRSTGRALAAAHALGLQSGYAITFAGAETFDLASGVSLAWVPLADDSRAAVLAAARKLDLAVETHESPAGTLRLVVTAEAQRLELAALALEEAGQGTVCLLSPRAGVLVVQAASATKEHALAALAHRLGIDAAAVAYLGDAADDAPALRWAGLGVAMAVGSPEAHGAAQVVVPRSLVPETIVRLALARRLRAWEC